MSNQTLSITERTNIPLFAVICTLPFIIGAVGWLTSVDAKATASLKKAEYLEIILNEVRDSQIRLETKFGTLPKQKTDF